MASENDRVQGASLSFQPRVSKPLPGKVQYDLATDHPGLKEAKPNKDGLLENYYIVPGGWPEFLDTSEKRANHIHDCLRSDMRAYCFNAHQLHYIAGTPGGVFGLDRISMEAHSPEYRLFVKGDRKIHHNVKLDWSMYVLIYFLYVYISIILTFFIF